MSYADLEPFYDRAEYELGVSGKAGNLQGRKIDGGNVFEAPRNREYPLPALLVGPIRRALSKAAPASWAITRSLRRARFFRSPIMTGASCTYCGFCQSFGCHVGAKSSILVTKLPEADATGNFKLLTGTMCYRVNSDNSGRATGVSYYGPDGSDNTIEAEIVILAPFIYDNTRLLLLSKTDKFPNGLGEFQRPSWASMSWPTSAARVFAAFDDRFVNIYMGPSAQKHSLDDFNADNFDHSGLGFIRGAQISVAPADLEAGPIGTAMSMNPPPGTPRWGAAYRDFIAKIFRALRRASSRRPKTCPTPIRPSTSIRACAISMACRRRASPTIGGGPTNSRASNSCTQKLEAIGHAMGATHVWRAPLGAGAPGAHHEGGTRMGNDPKTSVVNRYGQTWDIPNLFVIGSSTFPSMSGFNPTLTIQALAYMSADAIVKRYKSKPGPLV